MTRLKKWLASHPLVIECSFIFLSCAFIYLANGRATASGDTWSNSQLAFNWFLDKTLNFDAFRPVFAGGRLPHSLVEAPNGHLTSSYPVGPALLTSPLYFLFSIYLTVVDWLHQFSDHLGVSGLSLGSDIPQLTEREFQYHRADFAKLASTITTSLSVVIFYLTTRLKFNPFIALTVTFVYAFATSTWSINSQALFQHPVSNLELISAILCLFKANRSQGNQRKILLLTAGFFCGLLPGTRPTCLLFSIAIIVYAGFVYRKAAVFLLIGCLSFLFSAIWNIYYFGFSLKNLLVGGYSSLFDGLTDSAYIFTPDHFLQAFHGLTVSPSRGLFIFSPILLFSFYGAYKVFKLRQHPDELLQTGLSIAAGVIFFQYCFYFAWGIGPYGARLTLDIIVVACYLLAYTLSDLVTTLQVRRTWKGVLLVSLFLSFTLFSTAVQAVGAFGSGSWRSIPISESLRLREWRDNEIARNANSLYFKIFNPIEDSEAYLKGLAGTIHMVKTMETGQPLSSPFIVQPSKSLILEAQLTNMGTSQWFGYETGIHEGATRIAVQFIDSTGQQVKGLRNFLFVSGTPKTGETTTALGNIIFPSDEGKYKAVFLLEARRIGRFPGDRPAFEFEVDVKAN